MDTEDRPDLIRHTEDEDRTWSSSLSAGGFPPAADAPPKNDTFDDPPQDQDKVRGQPVGFGGQKPLTDRCLHPWQAEVRMEEEGEGVTSEAAEPAISSLGQMGVPLLTEKLTKMITAVQDGPVASGDGRAVEQLNIQDLRDIRDAAASLKIVKNAAVQAACGNLDDQEGRGWLCADTLGITLIHSHKAPTEGHNVGKQIDEILSDAKAHCDRLKGAARKRKTDARKRGLHGGGGAGGEAEGLGHKALA